MPLPRPNRFRAGAALCAATAALAVAVALPGSASASPSGECRDVACTGTLAVGSMTEAWSSPQVFYPNNEEFYASASVGRMQLNEVRVYGPALCRHRFVGASMTVVIKACGPQTPLRVHAFRRKAGVRNLRITYAARPNLGDPAESAPAPLSGSIYDALRQITGLLIG